MDPEKQPQPAPDRSDTGDAARATVPNTPKAAGQLTPEEQMAAFEKELKENDWGHQPC